MAQPYVISWNLTYRCNLACEHCYLDAGSKKNRVLKTFEFSDRSELGTEECFRVIEQIADFAPECLTILTGGEPLLRQDILEIISYASKKGLWVVVGTNGVLITEDLVRRLVESGARGMALSLDALDAEVHDKFRRVRGAHSNTVNGAKVLSKNGLHFIVQTTVGKHNAAELSALADFAYSELGAKVWNLYFLVQTGRGQFITDLTPEDYSSVLEELHGIQQRYFQKMVVNAKCAPHYVTTLLQKDPESPFVRTFTENAGGCPAGTHYLGIRPNGDVTPCPYLPVFGGSVRQKDLKEIWQSSNVFVKIRSRGELGGRCGACDCRAVCGGCRARAFGVSADFMGEDPLCRYELGTLKEKLVALGSANSITYGNAAGPELPWDGEAKERVKRIPSFVRGMVVRSVEKYCSANGHPRVTIELLNEVRSRMPTPKLFGMGGANEKVP